MTTRPGWPGATGTPWSSTNSTARWSLITCIRPRRHWKAMTPFSLEPYSSTTGQENSRSSASRWCGYIFSAVQITALRGRRLNGRPRSSQMTANA